MHFLITYDITSNRMRLNVARILDDFGDRVQESVFELPNLDALNWNKCLKRLKDKIKLTGTDSIRVYILCDSCRKKIMLLGHGPKPMDDPDVIVI